ncbi:MAG: Uma2 family endonuclease [Azonexus sp.]|jgi:Uma2 family endonuclease|nr:Uma2 family endonuclease [Azonexus sp.]
MSALPQQKPATYQDLFDLPPHVVGEIVSGTLYTHPRPAPKHARSSSILGGKLTTRFDEGDDGPGGWVILFEPELHLDRNILVPNLAGWRRERMPQLPETAWFELAPDWLCEVLSPATARLDRVQKMPCYHAAGVTHLWLIDPDLQTLEAFEREQNRWALIGSYAGQDSVRVPPFDAVEIALNNLWSLDGA